MKLWLDDVRPAPKTWTHAKTVNEAIALLTEHAVTEASLDHDLDLLDEDPYASTGYDFCLWMIQSDIWPSESIVVHSANCFGAKSMCDIIDRYGPYTQPCVWLPNWD